MKTPVPSALNDRFLTAKDAANLLGVSVPTLYVYVGKKGIRSRSVPGTRSRLYWKADLERIKRVRPGCSSVQEPAAPTELTYITGQDLLYRGQSAVKLAGFASLETVAALLWEVEESYAFTTDLLAAPPVFGAVQSLLRDQPDLTRAAALLPLLDAADALGASRCRQDLGRTGANILRWLAAIVTGAADATDEPLHLVLGRRLGRGSDDTELIRPLLVLAADHGLEQSALAVRSVAASGVSLWRAVAAGLSVSTEQRKTSGWLAAIAGLLDKIEHSPEPGAIVKALVADGGVPPGFQIATYGHDEPVYHTGDPRARALLGHCGKVMGSAPSFRRLKAALSTARESAGLEPNFALACLFVIRSLGLDPAVPLFAIGRCVGWIAHAIEQKQSGLAVHARAVYTGPLPPQR